MGLHVANSLCICLWKKSSPFQFIFFFSFRQTTEAGATAGGKVHTSLCFSVIHHIVRVHFQTISTRIMLFNPYHMLVGVPYGFCGIDEETEGLRGLPGVTGLIKVGHGSLFSHWAPCPFPFFHRMKWKERDAGPGTSPLVSMYQGQVSTLGRSLTPEG